MKTNIKLTVYLTTSIMSEALAKRPGAIKPAGLAGIYDATFTRLILERSEMPFTPSVHQSLLCDLYNVAARPGNDSINELYCDRQETDV
ncbi:hypothetical protein RRF57_001536 [Xylaria bambusicola]|uniref:Uncharacterized protein n=1 Tax=Xylaria bambusicola TaxID=326684 RepID=A0AAN7YUZ7_9PEZI